jgi:hypothetical protein
LPGADPSALSDARVRELAHAILERPQYKNFRPESYDLFALVAEKWRALMDWLFGLREADAQLYWLLLCGLGAICLALVLHIVWTVRSALRSVPPPAASDVRVREHDFAREARMFADRGQHLEAAHRLLLASLRGLAQRRLIPLRPEDGNHAVCRQLSASGLPAALRGRLTELILETERAWYGAGEGPMHTPASLYQRWDAAYAQLSALGMRPELHGSARADAAAS